MIQYLTAYSYHPHTLPVTHPTKLITRIYNMMSFARNKYSCNNIEGHQTVIECTVQYRMWVAGAVARPDHCE
jgi:hypothetical protein